MCWHTSRLFFSLLVFGLECVAPQDYFDQRHAQRFKTQHMGHLKEIPKRFDVKGGNAKREFLKYINDIYDLAKEENVTVLYKVKVETMKPTPQFLSKKQGKVKPKKYNIPLKKKNMKLSNFEKIIRKLVDNSGYPQNNGYSAMTTEDMQKPKPIPTTKIPILKYKPIISRVNLNNYTKRIKPVRNLVITLTK